MARVVAPVPDDKTLSALIALNSWVRSESCRHFGGGALCRAIYVFKNEAVESYMRAGIDLSPVPVLVEALCRDCGGSGHFWDQYGAEYDHCYRCHNTDKVHLEFIQSTIPGGQVWHSPREPLKCAPSLLRAVAGIDAVPADGAWGVGRAGHDLSYPDLANALNVVESWQGGPPRHYMFRWDTRDPWGYKLPLGERPQTCAFCGGELGPSPMCYNTADRFFRWSDWCCGTCEKRFYPKSPPFPVPQGLMSPAAAKWRAGRDLWTEYHRVPLPGFLKKSPLRAGSLLFDGLFFLSLYRDMIL